MHGTMARQNGGATQSTVRSDSEKSSAVQMDGDDEKWFSIPARALLGSDPGLALHMLTGISESSGYRYANGLRGVPGKLLRLLLRSDHGRQWLNAIMDGCEAEWWRDHKRAERIVFQIDQLNLD